MRKGAQENRQTVSRLLALSYRFVNDVASSPAKTKGEKSAATPIENDIGAVLFHPIEDTLIKR